MRIELNIMKHLVKYCFTVLISLAAFTSNAEDMMPAKDGYYIGASYVSNGIGEEFDDTKVLTSSTMAMVIGVPKIDNGTGFSLFWGQRTGDGAFEIDYINTQHNTTSIAFGNSTASFTSIDFNGKFYFNTATSLQPYALLGFGFQWLTIKNNTATASGFNDTDFTGGRSLNIGGGLSYYITPQWFLTGGALYRWGSFGMAEGLKIQDRVGHSGLMYTGGIAFIF